MADSGNFLGGTSSGSGTVPIAGGDGFGDIALGEPKDWRKVDGKALLECLDLASRAGARMTFGRSRSSGALSVNVFYQGTPHNWYPETEQACTELLRAITTRFSSILSKSK